MPKPMPMEEKIEYFMQERSNIHITIHMPGGGCVRRIFVKSDNLQVELALEYDEN